MKKLFLFLTLALLALAVPAQGQYFSCGDTIHEQSFTVVNDTVDMSSAPAHFLPVGFVLMSGPSPVDYYDATANFEQWRRQLHWPESRGIVALGLCPPATLPAWDHYPIPHLLLTSP